MLKAFLLFVATMVAVASATALPKMNKITDLPGLSYTEGDMYSGFLSASNSTTSDANIFYWYIESRNSPVSDPLVLWLTGGPGCSSELALLFENGPFSLAGDGKTLEKNPNSWNTNANLLYVDQPVGTGFSPADGEKVRTEAEVAADLIQFLREFKTMYGLNKKPLIVTGESFAGHYIPALTASIVDTAPDLLLRGVGIGNGWTAPAPQSASYGPFLAGAGKISWDLANKYNHTAATCEDLLAKKHYDLAAPFCDEYMQVMLDACQTDGKPCNVYNYDAPCTVPGLCYDFSAQTAYMNTPELRAALGIPDFIAKWATCDPSDISNADHQASFVDALVEPLKKGVKVIVYNGDQDIVCNFYGTEKYLNSEAMEFPGSAAFKANLATGRQSFLDADGNECGEFATGGDLAYVKVYKAGHMVPHDTPKCGSAILNHLIANAGGDEQ